MDPEKQISTPSPSPSPSPSPAHNLEKPIPSADHEDKDKDSTAALSPSHSSSSPASSIHDVERPPPPTEQQQNEASSKIIDFSGPDDPSNPKNWPVRRRMLATAGTALMTFVVTFASSVFTSAIGPVMEEFHVSMVVSTLGVSLFLLGFVFGPAIFGPASELFGRRAPLLAGYFVFAVFQIPVALAKNITTILVCRFIGGFAACAPLAILGGVVADLWEPVERAYAICFFSFAAFGGPVAGPIVGGFVTQSYLGWRWTAWLTLIAAGACGLFGYWVIPETSSKMILGRKARERRRETGDREWKVKGEVRITPGVMVSVYLVRPWKMLAQEPILALMTAYMSFIYGVLYLLFEAFPVSFHDQRGWNLGVSALPFASFIVGTAIGCSIMAYSSATNFKRAYLKAGVCVPEERLPPMMLGAIVLPIGFFWFGWTSSPHITWVPQVLAVSLIGMGEVVTFWEGLAYLIDCYGFYSNSAIAVNTFIRSIAGAAFPLFAVYMYENLGVAWASSLLGFLCLLFIPAPFLFYKYGASIRARSQWAPTG